MAGMAAACGGAGVESGDDALLGRLYFAGSDAVLGGEARWLKEIAAIPASGNLRAVVAERMARAPRELLRRRLDAGAPDHKETFRALWEEWRRSESAVEIRRNAAGRLDWAMAVRLSSARGEDWSDGLRKALGSWGMNSASECRQGQGRGWEMRAGDGAEGFRFLRAGEWCLMGWSADPASLMAPWLSAVEREGRPVRSERGIWLKADWNWATARALWPSGLWKANGLANGSLWRLTVGPEQENLRTRLEMNWQEAPAWSGEAWQLPTNLVREPLISFTAAQGVGSWLKECEFLKRLPWNPWPNQVFFWAQGAAPFQVFGAIPTRSTTNVIRRMAEASLSGWASNLTQRGLGKVQWVTNETILVWTGLPVVVPYACAAVDGSDRFVQFGVFAVAPNTNPAPAQLWSQVAGRSNQLFYSWEITGERLLQAKVLSQILRIAAPPEMIPIHPDLSQPDSLEQTWLDAVARFLGNTVTEITRETPTRYLMSRRGHLGLTATELVLLVNAIDDPRFPLFGYALPPGGGNAKRQ